MSKNKTPAWRLGIHLDISNRLWQEAMNKNITYTKINRPHWLALSAIDELGDNCNMTQICDYLQCEVSTCSRALAFLEKSQLVTKTVMAGDKRAKGVAITAEGKHLLEELDIHAEASRKQLLLDVSPEQLATFKYVVEKIKERALCIIQREDGDAEETEEVEKRLKKKKHHSL